MIRFFSVLISIIFLTLIHIHSQTLDRQTTDLQKQYGYYLKLMGEEQYQLAIKGFQKLLSDYPEFQLPYRNIVEAYIFLGDLVSAQSYFQSLKDKDPQNPYPYYALARIDFQKGENHQAIEKLKKCISLDPTFPEAYGPFGGLPEIYKAINDLNAGEDYFKQLINQYPNNPYPYYGLGRIYVKGGSWDNALQFYNKSLEIDSSVAYDYHASLFVYSVKGEYKLALKYGRKLLRISQRQNDLEMVAYALLNIGGFYFLGGNFEKALSYFNQSYEISSAIGAKRREGMALTNIGTLYATLGKKNKALEYFQESLDLLKKTEAFRTEIRTLYNIGLIHKDLQQYSEAFGFFNKALTLAEDQGYKLENCMVLTGFAETYNKLEKYEFALTKYLKAFEVAKEIKDKAKQGYILTKLGDLYYERDDFQTAINYQSKALHLGFEIHDAQIIWGTNTGLGAAYQKINEDQKAVYYFSKAIAIYDSIRKNINIESLTSGFLEDEYEVYPSLIQLLGNDQQVEEAFAFTEKYKANTLLKVLAKGQFLISGLLPDSIRFSLLEIENHLQNIHSELSGELSKGDQDKEKILNLDQQVAALEIEKSSIIKSIEKNYNPYYQITSSEPVSLEELQSNFLKPNQLLIEFVVGTHQTSVFAIGKDTLIYKSIMLSREKLKKMFVNLSSVFQSLTTDDRKQANDIFTSIQADFEIPPSYALYETLFKQIQPMIDHYKELIIIPDDFLYYLPFEMLVTDTSSIQNRYDFQNAHFLIERTNISYLQSASLLNPRLRIHKKPSGSLLAFGNPTFNSTDEQKPDNSRNTLLPLPNSEKEVKNISHLIGGSPHVFIGQNATEKIFKEEASDYKIIHLASHFEINDYDPLYSRVAFSQKNDSVEDGYLQTYEVFDLHLNADLVVLSACNTALGKLSKGEGIIGMSRAFLYAGVPSMVVSLWNVEDEATSLIMGYFYKNLKQGMEKSEALRFAKLDYLKSVKTTKKDPFFWAPFVLFGDLTPIKIQDNTNYFNLVIYLAILMVVVSSLFIFKKRAFHKRR